MVAVGQRQIAVRGVAVVHDLFQTLFVRVAFEKRPLYAEHRFGNDREAQIAPVGSLAAELFQQIQLEPGPQGIGFALKIAPQNVVGLPVGQKTGVETEIVVQEPVGVINALVVAAPPGCERVVGLRQRAGRQAAHDLRPLAGDGIVRRTFEVGVFIARIGGRQQRISLVDESPDDGRVIFVVSVGVVPVRKRIENIRTGDGRRTDKNQK